MKKFLPVILLFGLTLLALAACSSVSGITGIAPVLPAASMKQADQYAD